MVGSTGGSSNSSALEDCVCVPAMASQSSGCILLLDIDPEASFGNRRSIETRPPLECGGGVTCWASALKPSWLQAGVSALGGNASSANTLDECRTNDLHLMRFFLSACWMVVAASCALERVDSFFFFFLLPLDLGTVAAVSGSAVSLIDALTVIAVIVVIVSLASPGGRCTYDSCSIGLLRDSLSVTVETGSTSSLAASSAVVMPLSPARQISGWLSTESAICGDDNSDELSWVWQFALMIASLSLRWLIAGGRSPTLPLPGPPSVVGAGSRVTVEAPLTSDGVFTS